MELRQLRYFVRVCELGSMGRAAIDLGVVTSALSQQISRLEGELSTRLLHRSATGVSPTDAGLAFWRQAQLALRTIEDATRAAQQARLSGHVSVGLAPSTGGVLGLAFMEAMRSRYPEVRLRMVEALSGHLTSMLNARQIDLAIVFREDIGQRWNVTPLLDEQLFVIAAQGLADFPQKRSVRLSALADLPLIMPSGSHGLRALLDQSFARAKREPRIVAEVDGLALLMDAVRGGLGATIQPGAVLTRYADASLAVARVSDAHVRRRNLLVSLPEQELSPAGLAARVVLTDVATVLVQAGHWIGARLHES